MENNALPPLDKKALLALRVCATAREHKTFSALLQASFRLTETLHAELIKQGWNELDATEAMSGLLEEQASRLFDRLLS